MVPKPTFGENLGAYLSLKTCIIVNKDDYKHYRSSACDRSCLMLAVCSSEADVVFIIDSSASLDEPNFDHIKDFVSDVVSGLDVDSGRIRVGVVTYSDFVEPRFNLFAYNTRSDMTIRVSTAYTVSRKSSDNSVKSSPICTLFNRCNVFCKSVLNRLSPTFNVQFLDTV